MPNSKVKITKVDDIISLCKGFYITDVTDYLAEISKAKTDNVHSYLDYCVV